MTLTNIGELILFVGKERLEIDDNLEIIFYYNGMNMQSYYKI